jgi:hypothetical protein
MTPTGGLRSVGVPSLPSVPTRAGRLAPVCSASAPSSSRPRRRVMLSAACVVFTPRRHAVLPRDGVLGGAATLGNSPQTR